MAPFASNGSLTTDKRTVNDTTTWDTQSDWEAYQSKGNVTITNGVLELTETTYLALIDSFEDAGLSEYAFSQGSQYVSVLGSLAAADGSQYLEYDGDGRTQMGSTSGLDYYPAPGDIFAFNFWVVSEGNNADRIGWGSVDDTYSSQYNVEFNQGSGDGFRLVKAGNSITNTTLDSANFPADQYTSRYLECEVEWATNGDMTATLWESPDRNNQLAQVSANDSSLGAGGIGYQFYSGAPKRLDFYRKTGEL